MAYKPYYECPLCLAHLDHGEKCTCEQERKEREKKLSNMFQYAANGQMSIKLPVKPV